MKCLSKSFVAAAAIVFTGSSAAMAHPAEQAFVLLLPTDVYATAGTLAVVLSIVLVTCVRPQLLRGFFSARDLGRWPVLPTAVVSISALASLVYGLLVYVGFYGPSDPQNNLLPLTVWTAWWIAAFVVQGLVLDIWRLINPWEGLHRLVFEDAAGPLRLPEWLQAWPAVCIFLAFQGFVLADIAPNDPRRLASFALGYWVFTFAGMTLFGRAAWLAQVECFTFLFRLIGSLRPVDLQGRFKLGFVGWQSLLDAPLDLSRAVFCLIILASGSFDGLHETFWWLGRIGVNPLEFPGRSAVIAQSLLGLYASNAALIGIFALSVWIGIKTLAAVSSETHAPFATAFCTFAIAILPIALGYHIAHYLVTLMIQGQYVLSTLSDPLARGWNLFGLGDLRITTGFLNTQASVKVIWLTQAGAVVVSHLISVLMTHHLAGRFCNKNKDLISIQIGLSVLMIAYTIFGLWLLASPRGA
jgi:hypothetical protein